MNRTFRHSMLLSVLLAFLSPSLPAAGLIVEGRVLDRAGKAVPGAEVSLTDPAGKIRHRVLSDMEGRYRFPVLRSVPDDASGYGVSVRHLRYKPAQVKGLVPTSPQPGHLLPGQSPALLLSSRILSGDVRLEPGPAPSGMAAANQRDPNLGEYYYQQALLFLGRNKRKEAVEYLKLYAQIGANPRQIARALSLIAQHDKK